MYCRVFIPVSIGIQSEKIQPTQNRSFRRRSSQPNSCYSDLVDVRPDLLYCEGGASSFNLKLLLAARGSPPRNKKSRRRPRITNASISSMIVCIPRWHYHMLSQAPPPCPRGRQLTNSNATENLRWLTVSGEDYFLPFTCFWTYLSALLRSYWKCIYFPRWCVYVSHSCLPTNTADRSPNKSSARTDDDRTSTSGPSVGHGCTAAGAESQRGRATQFKATSNVDV